MVYDHPLLKSLHSFWSSLHHQIPTLQTLHKEHDSIAVTKCKSNTLQSFVHTLGGLLHPASGGFSWIVRCYVQCGSNKKWPNKNCYWNSESSSLSAASHRTNCKVSWDLERLTRTWLGKVPRFWPWIYVTNVLITYTMCPVLV